MVEEPRNQKIESNSSREGPSASGLQDDTFRPFGPPQLRSTTIATVAYASGNNPEWEASIQRCKSGISIYMNRTEPIGEDKLKQLHEDIRKYRQLGSGSGGRKAQSRNDEAIVVGCTIDMQSGDTILMPPAAACQNQQPNLITLSDDINRLGVSMGIAFASAMRRDNCVVMSFLEVSPPQSVVPLLRFAQERSLPIICVAMTPIPRPPKKKELPPVIRVDANDVIAIYRVAYESIAKARRGAGPTWIECVRSRRGTTNASGPRSTATTHKEPSALERLEQYMKKRNLWPMRS